MGTVSIVVCLITYRSLYVSMSLFTDSEIQMQCRPTASAWPFHELDWAVVSGSLRQCRQWETSQRL